MITAFPRVSNDILRAIYRKKCMLLVSLDLPAAFYTIDEDILLKLFQYQLSINGNDLQSMTFYLTHRAQCISINEERKSVSKQLTCGVPQGSVLGPPFLTHICQSWVI